MLSINFKYYCESVYIGRIFKRFNLRRDQRISKSFGNWKAKNGLGMAKMASETGCCGQDVKRYASGVQLNNRRVLRTPGPRTKYFKCFFVVQ